MFLVNTVSPDATEKKLHVCSFRNQFGDSLVFKRK